MMMIIIIHLYADDMQIQGSCRLGLPTSCSPPCQLAWMKCLTGCGQMTYSWTLWRRRSSTRRQNHLPSATVPVGVNHMLPSTTVRDLGILIESDVTTRSCVSRTVSGCFALLWQVCSIRRSVSWLCVPFSHVAGYVMCRLWQSNTCRTSCVSTLSTLVSATDSSIFSVWEWQTDAAPDDDDVIIRSHLHWLRSPESIVFQAGYARLPLPACSGATVSFQLQPFLVVIILAASDPMYTAVHCWWSCISSGWKPPLEQSAAWHHLSSNDDYFLEPLQNFSFPDHFLSNSFFWFLHFAQKKFTLFVLVITWSIWPVLIVFDNIAAEEMCTKWLILFI